MKMYYKNTHQIYDLDPSPYMSYSFYTGEFYFNEIYIQMWSILICQCWPNVVDSGGVEHTES